MEAQLGVDILQQLQDNAAPRVEIRLQQRATELRDVNRDLAAQRDELAASLLRHREEFDAVVAARAAFDAASTPPPPTEAPRAPAAAPGLSTKDSTFPPVSSTTPGSTASTPPTTTDLNKALDYKLIQTGAVQFKLGLTGDPRGDRKRFLSMFRMLANYDPRLHGLSAEKFDVTAIRADSLIDNFVAIVLTLMVDGTDASTVVDVCGTGKGADMAQAIYDSYVKTAKGVDVSSAFMRINGLSLLGQSGDIRKFLSETKEAFKAYELASDSKMPEVLKTSFLRRGIDVTALAVVLSEWVRKDVQYEEMMVQLLNMRTSTPTANATVFLAASATPAKDAATLHAKPAPNTPHCLTPKDDDAFRQWYTGACDFCNIPGHCAAECFKARKHDWDSRKPRPIALKPADDRDGRGADGYDRNGRGGNGSRSGNDRAPRNAPYGANGSDRSARGAYERGPRAGTYPSHAGAVVPYGHRPAGTDDARATGSYDPRLAPRASLYLGGDAMLQTRIVEMIAAVQLPSYSIKDGIGIQDAVPMVAIVDTGASLNVFTGTDGARRLSLLPENQAVTTIDAGNGTHHSRLSMDWHGKVQGSGDTTLDIPEVFVFPSIKYNIISSSSMLRTTGMVTIIDNDPRIILKDGRVIKLLAWQGIYALLLVSYTRVCGHYGRGPAKRLVLP